MDPTTLLTFLFQAPSHIRQVELFGSWDNFTQSYRMHHDRRRGTGFWSGCFKYENIIFDGIEPQWTRPRSGGLKQGGVYWYYYRLDDDMEAYDDMLPHTTNCPLMPGQVLNVVEVPVEIVEPVSRCRSASADIAGTLANLPLTHTLDPRAKFAALDPPPVSKIHERSMSDFALGGRLENLRFAADHSVSPSSFPKPRWPVVQRDTASVDRRPSKRLRSSSGNSEHARKSRPSTYSSRDHLSVIDSYTDRREPQIGSWSVREAGRQAPPVRSPDLEDYEQFNLDFDDSSDSSDRDPSDLREDPNDNDEDAPSSCDREPRHSEQLRHSRLMAHDEAAAAAASPRWQPPMYTVGDHALQNNHTQEAQRSSSLSPVTAAQHGATLDICSPTFSAATVSSKDGLNTPFRLSVAYSPGATAYTTEDPGAEFEDVAHQLQSLDVVDDDHESSSRSQLTEYRYILPETLAAESVHSLGKLSLPPDGHGHGHVPGLALPDFLQETTAIGSMADDIFSELGYLSGSIE